MSTLITSFTLIWRGTERSMEAPICAWHGAMRSLPGKLEPLLSEPEYGLRKGEKNKIKLLKGDLQELIAKYLIEPSEVESPGLTANCWLKEVRELSYDIDDFVDELVHVAVQRNLGGKTTKLREGLSQGPRVGWVADEVSGFRTRVKEAIHRHRSYNLDKCKRRPSSSASDERPLPPLYGMEAAGLDSVDHKREKLEGWLTDDAERRLRVVSILGLGGVGKTTLAKQLYCKLGRRFECRAFVRTSRKPDIRSLLTSILLQVRRHQAPNTWEANNLIEMIRAQLHDKKYFVIIDDLWASSTWDIVSRALPDGNCCSRILTTTEVDIVAETCSGHNSECIFKMEPLGDNGSRELFFSRVFGHQYEYPEQFNKVSSEIIRKCGGLPLATITTASLLASQPDRIEQWNCIQNSLSSNLRTNLTLEGVKQVLKLSYDNLPHRLKACMLYFSLYQEDYTICKNDLVKQWIAEGFICANEGKDMEEVARSYFDELVNRGMIQPVDINYNGEVLSCTVHHMVLNLIRYKSIEDNFITAIDYSQTAIRLAEKVRRLSLHFGNAEYATPPTNLRLSQVRSLAFFGLFKSIPSIVEFKLLQVLILELWADYDDKSYDLTGISELFRLRYLRIKACHWIIELPMQMQRLKNLATLEIEARVSEVPSDIVDLPGLLYLCLPSECELPHGIGHMTSLRTLGNFNLSSNSTENVMNLGELTNLQDLLLTCSTVQPDNLKNNMQCLGSILSKISNLKSLTLLPSAANTNTLVAGASSYKISCDLSSVSTPPTLLQRLELLPRICIFSVLPMWIKELCKLCILKIEIMELSSNDIDILEGLPALTALSLYVWTAPSKSIVIDKTGFPILKYFKFRCTAPCLSFAAGAMLNVRSLKLGFNVNRMKQYSPVDAGFEHLTGLTEIYAKIVYADADKSDRSTAESTLRDATSKNPNKPIVNVKWVNCIFYGDEEKSITTQQENQAVIAEEGLDKQHGIQEEVSLQDTDKQADSRVSLSSELSSQVQNPGEDKSTTTQEENRQIIEKQTEIVEEDSKEKHGIQAVSRTYMPSESTLHLQNPDEDKGTITQEEKQQVLEMQAETVEEDSSEQYGIQEKHSGEDINKPADSGTSVPSESSLHMQNPGEDKSTATGMGKHGALQKQDVTMEKDTDEQLGNQEKDPREDINKREDNRSMPSESSSHPRKQEEVKSTMTKEDEHQRLEEQDVVVVGDSNLRHGFQESSVDDIDKRRASGVYKPREISPHPYSPGRVRSPHPYSPGRERYYRPYSPNKERSYRPNSPVNRGMVPPMERGMANAFSNVVKMKLFSELEKKYHLWKGVKEVSESLRRDLEILVSQMDEELIKLRDAPRTRVARVHTAEMRDLTHDIEDCIELFLHRVTCEEGAPRLSRTAHGAKTFYTRLRFGAKMKKLNKRLKDISDRISNLPATAAPAGGGRRDPVERNPVGIALAKGELLALLDEVEDQKQQPQRLLRVISIVGFGGSGKTTLARAVYDSPQAQHPLFCCGVQPPQFCCREARAWVDRWEYTDASGLLKKIIQKVWPEAGQDVLQETNEELLQNHLRGHLKYKRYLIVMDDIDLELWDWITSTFEDNGTSSRIIVTTTNQETAHFCSFGNGYVYKMRTIGYAASKKIALLDTSDLEHSLTLLKKCDGLPLALVSVANHFRSKKGPTENLCKDLCGRLGSYLHETANENTDHFARLRGVLMGNYTSQPNYNVRTCLLYLGIFPNDRPLKRNVIIRRWLAEGYALSDNPQILSEQQVADDNFKEFINRNIIQPVGISNNEVLKTCKIHGIVHEFMLHKSISENFIMSSDAPKHKNVFPIDKRHKKVRHLFVNGRNDTNSGTTLNVDLSCVRSLTVSGNAGGAISNFRKYKLMRVLDLEECSDVNDHHLKDICNLWNLRYLSLGPNITVFPREFAKLKLLETLDVSKTSVTVLPVEVIGLPCLTHLIGKFKLPHQDGTVSSDLEQLSKNCKLKTLAGFVADGSQGFLQLMAHMKNLRKVRMWCEYTGDITNLNNHLIQAIQKYTEAPMGEGRSLSIDLQGLPDEDSRHALRELYNHSLRSGNKYYLTSLKLHGNVPTLPEFVGLLFCGLTELCLSLTTVTRDLLSALSNMPSLVFLKLMDSQIDGGLVIQVGAFKRLEHLRFVLRGPHPVIPQIQDGALPKLVSLQLLCKHLAGLSGIVIRHLKNLKEIELDPGVNDQTRGEWEAAARNHPNRPDVLPFKSVDDPMGNEPTEDPIAQEEAAPDTGSEPQRSQYLELP